METLSIKRQGSYLYARACAVVVVFLTLLYGGMGAVLAIITESDLDDVLEEIIYPILAFIPVLMMWTGYAAMLWAFKREASHTIVLNGEGIREIRSGREHKFIPWAGVRIIELDADLFGGLSLKAKGTFSEIAISNVDLVVTRPMSLRQMHRAMGKLNHIGKLYSDMRTAAPAAELKMNKLARHRMSQYAWAAGDARTR